MSQSKNEEQKPTAPLHGRTVKSIRSEPGTPKTPSTPILAPQWPNRDTYNSKTTKLKRNDSCERLFTFSVSTRASRGSSRPASANAAIGVQKQLKDANDAAKRIRIYYINKPQTQFSRFGS